MHHLHQFHQSIFAQLLRAWIPQAKKIGLSHQYLFTFMGSAQAEVDEIEPRFPLLF